MSAELAETVVVETIASMLDFVSSTMDVTNKPADGVAHGDGVDLDDIPGGDTSTPFILNKKGPLTTVKNIERTAGTSKGTRTSKRQSGKAGEKPDSSGEAVSQSTKTTEGSTKRIRKATRTFDETPSGSRTVGRPSRMKKDKAAIGDSAEYFLSVTNTSASKKAVKQVKIKLPWPDKKKKTTPNVPAAASGFLSTTSPITASNGVMSNDKTPSEVDNFGFQVKKTATSHVSTQGASSSQTTTSPLPITTGLLSNSEASKFDIIGSKVNTMPDNSIDSYKLSSEDDTTAINSVDDDNHANTLATLLNQADVDNSSDPEDTVVDMTIADSDNEVADPAVADPAVADPAVADPAVADPEVADPAVADPAVADPAVADPAVADPEVADPEVAEPEPPCSSEEKIEKQKQKRGTRTRQLQQIWVHSTVTAGFKYACKGCSKAFANPQNVYRHWSLCEQNPERDLTQNKCENPKCTAAFPGNPSNLRRHMAAMMTLANGELYCRTKGQSKDSANGVLTPRTRRKRPIADTVQSDEDSDDVAGPRTDTRLKRRKVSAAPRLRVRGDRERGQGPSLYAAEEAALKQKNESIKAGQPVPAPNRRELRYDLDLKEPTQEELRRHIEHITERQSNYGLKITNYTGGSKGRRVYSEVVFYPGDFIALYPGRFVSDQTAKELDDLFTSMGMTNSYIIRLHLPKIGWSNLDATAESPFFGRLMNHSIKFPNCRPRTVDMGSTVRVYMQATKIILPNSELLWNYGKQVDQVNITQLNGHDSDGQMGVSPGVDSVVD